MMSKRGSSSKEAEATPDKKRRKTESLPVADTPKQSRTTPSQQVQADSHFIVHLFVTAIAGGKLQQGLLPQKTWDVLHQVLKPEIHKHTLAMLSLPRSLVTVSPCPHRHIFF
jgi:hypothetical protein